MLDSLCEMGPSNLFLRSARNPVLQTYDISKVFLLAILTVKIFFALEHNFKTILPCHIGYSTIPN